VARGAMRCGKLRWWVPHSRASPPRRPPLTSEDIAGAARYRGIEHVDFGEHLTGEVSTTALLCTFVERATASLPAHPLNPYRDATTARREKAASSP
jgi:hypothetical protein